SRIGCGFHIGKSETGETAQKLCRSGRRVEFACFLTCGSCKLTDKVFVSVAKHVDLGIFHGEVQLVHGCDDFRHYCASILNGVTELCGIKDHIREQAFKVNLALVTDSAFHERVDCALKELDIKGTSFNQCNKLAEEILRLNYEA